MSALHFISPLFTGQTHGSAPTKAIFAAFKKNNCYAELAFYLGVKGVRGVKGVKGVKDKGIDANIA